MKGQLTFSDVSSTYVFTVLVVILFVVTLVFGISFSSPLSPALRSVGVVQGSGLSYRASFVPLISQPFALAGALTYMDDFEIPKMAIMTQVTGDEKYFNYYTARGFVGYFPFGLFKISLLDYKNPNKEIVLLKTAFLRCGPDAAGACETKCSRGRKPDPANDRECLNGMVCCVEDMDYDGRCGKTMKGFAGLTAPALFSENLISAII